MWLLVETTGGVKPRRKRKANTAMALVETPGFKVGLFPLGSSFRPKSNSISGWHWYPSIQVSGSELFEVSQGQGETGQFKADRLREWATRHSNF